MPLIQRYLIMKNVRRLRAPSPEDSLRGRLPFSLCLQTSYLCHVSN
jgi:hypothetical protein